jgi:SAM-dependent methyltransferase
MENEMTMLFRLVLAFALAFGIACDGAWAQSAAKPYVPEIGQEGKDVIWVPTPQALVDRMLEMAKVTPQDYVIDLGSGDGRTVITAAKLGAKAHGIEYNPNMVALAKHNAQQAGVGDRATFVQGDIFESDFSQATVVTMFLLSRLNIRLRPILLDMKPGTRVVSNSFTMGDWEADDTATVTEDCTSFCKAYFWIVPAKVDGEWKMGERELTINQEYQKFTGQVKSGNVVAPIKDGRLTGDKITFTAGDTRYTGTVSGNAMEGTAKSGSGEAKWAAKRK